MILQWEGEVLYFRFDVARDPAGVPPLDCEANIKVRGHGIMSNDSLRGDHAHLGYISQSHLTTIRRLDHQLADIGQTIAYFGGTPDDYIKDLLFLEEVANQDTGEQGSCRSTHFAGFDAIFLGCGKIHLDFQ